MIVHLAVGSQQHGVTMHAARLAAVAGEPILLLPARPPAEPRAEFAGRDVVLHFTDRPFGGCPDTAVVTALALVAGAARLTVALHDLPQASDGANRAARARAYLALAQQADAVVVSSRHEERLLQGLVRWAGAQSAGAEAERTFGEPVQVVPLPVEADPLDDDEAARPDAEPVVATLGFLYPGKGVEETVLAAARCHPVPEVVNLGAAAVGHEDLPGRLSLLGAQHGVRWSTTGWVPSHELGQRLRAVAVPVAAHRHLSASGSINSWLSAGRRPLVTRSRYAEELAARLPGTVTLVEPDEVALAAAIDRALGDPPSTWLGPGVRLGPSWREAATAISTIASGRAAEPEWR